MSRALSPRSLQVVEFLTHLKRHIKKTLMVIDREILFVAAPIPLLFHFDERFDLFDELALAQVL